MNESFRLWCEASNSGGECYVFHDLNETLIHELEVGWLKDCKGNKEYVGINTHGKHPHPGVVSVDWDKRHINVFPRPHVEEYLQELNKFATVVLLTHSERGWAMKSLGALKLLKYFKAVYSTRDLEPNELGNKYKLKKRQWVLVDNMKRDTVEMINKMRILGLAHPNCTIEDDGTEIMKEGKPHFVNVKDWYTTVDDTDDFELFRALPEIRKKLGLSITDS